MAREGFRCQGAAICNRRFCFSSAISNRRSLFSSFPNSRLGTHLSSQLCCLRCCGDSRPVANGKRQILEWLGVGSYNEKNYPAADKYFSFLGQSERSETLVTSTSRQLSHSVERATAESSSHCQLLSSRARGKSSPFRIPLDSLGEKLNNF